MIRYLAVLLFSLLALSLMLAALHFSRYKKRPSGCCGGLHCGGNREKATAGCLDQAGSVKNGRPRS